MNPDEIVYCDRCGERFIGQEAIEAHLRQDEETGQFLCDKCRKLTPEEIHKLRSQWD